ncbi:dipeptide epimerase [candidate division KSB1 bacterium]|nr:dipeptide epimerase [candidate division KSB1 bacterium]
MNRKNFLKLTGKSLLLAGVPAFGFNGLELKARRNMSLQNTGASLTCKVHKLLLKHTWTISRNSTDFKNNVFVKIKRDGIEGLGEAAPNIRYDETPESTVETIEKARPLFSQFDLWHYVDLGYAIKEMGTGQTAAKAALDIAIMDWIAKKQNMPLYQYLGLNKEKVPLTTFSIGIDTPEVIRQKVKEAEPYPILKIKVGLGNDREIIGAVRSVTDKPLRVDANEGWKNKEEALEKIKWLEKEGVEFIEQPMPASMHDDIRWLRERVNIPIVADEAVKTASDIPRLADAYDGINIKLMKSAGLQEALRMIAMARSLGLKIMLGCMIESSLAIAAAAQISPLVDWLDLDGNLLISNDPMKGHPVVAGKIILNDNPGLGVTSDIDF